MMKAPVFVDVDTGVDDALALIYLLASPEADVIGIASTGGNVAVQQVCENNLGLLELCRTTNIPVSKGSDKTLTGPMRAPSKVHGPRGMGYAELPPTDRRLTEYDSATAWVRAAHAFPGELVGVATGPLTNLALALRAEPALPSLLRRLVIMAAPTTTSATRPRSRNGTSASTPRQPPRCSRPGPSKAVMRSDCRSCAV